MTKDHMVDFDCLIKKPLNDIDDVWFTFRYFWAFEKKLD